MPKKEVNKHKFDIRIYKKNLRTKYKESRAAIPLEKRFEMDNTIFKNIVSLPQYTMCSVVLCFVSTSQEIDTHRFINTCLAGGKKVAVPYCIEGGRDMDFYYISSINDLQQRTFGVLEPVPEVHEITTCYEDSICIVPGLLFDKFGYRIGYGGGYYDRFLSNKYNGLLKIGICYENAVVDHITRGRYDVASDLIITEERIRKRKVSFYRNNKFLNRQKRQYD